MFCDKRGSAFAKIMCIIALIALINVFPISKGDSQKSERTTLPTSPGMTIPSSIAASPTMPESYTVGDTVTWRDFKITFLGVTENMGGYAIHPTDGNVYILCEFDIENTSDKDFTVDGRSSFETYVDDYIESRSINAMVDADKSDISAKIAPGKKTDGVVGYEVPADWQKIEIHFKPRRYSDSEVVFIYEKET